MPQIGTWIKRAVQQIVDPDREQRIEELTDQLHRGLQCERDKFSLDAFAERVGCTDRDLGIAKRNVYQAILDRAWQDDKVTAGEQKTIDWVAERLLIHPREEKLLQQEMARNRFAAAMSQAMDDGLLEAHEIERLEQIARSVGSTRGEFVRSYFRVEGETFLRGMFAACTEGGVLTTDVWNRLLKTAETLGLSKQDLVEAVHPQAVRFVEHVFADVNSDGILSEDEEKNLLSLIGMLALPSESSQYIRQRIAALRVIRCASEGRLPVIDTPAGVAIRAGEIIHFHSPATWLQKRVLKNGERWDEHVGAITISDYRILFSSDSRSFDIRFNRIVRHEGNSGGIRLLRSEKPESVIRLANNCRMAYAILEGAMALANQTRSANEGGTPNRHIPREVRQRVWQRYGGRCAECGAGDYLEFDHVIPVAKGGSNSDANVQLLCRRCNLKKSDFI